MRVESEIYKGIEFVRVFSLPDEQKSLFLKTFSRDKIIKILKDESLLNDCVQYSDYLAWYSENVSAEKAKEIKAPIAINPVLSHVLKAS